MMDQLSVLPAVDPDGLILEAQAKHRPVATFCLFSGGNDSMVVAHRCRAFYDALVWIDTGTAVPGVREFVVQAADWLGKPLRILEHDIDMWRLLVLGGTDWKGATFAPLGFPGPAQHGRAYNRLKERALERLLRESKAGHPRSARVLALSGVRRAESLRRRGRPEINRKGGMVFANPLIDWTSHDMATYRAEHDLPQSDVAALLHRSGECNCGSFAAPGEREMLQSLWPQWFEEKIASLEREAEAMGLRCPRWGTRCDLEPADDDPGELCSSCVHRQLQMDEQLTKGSAT